MIVDNFERSAEDQEEEEEPEDETDPDQPKKHGTDLMVWRAKQGMGSCDADALVVPIA